MTEQDLVTNSRLVEDQLDVTQLPTQEQDDRFDTPSASGWKREDNEGMHTGEQEQPPYSEMDHHDLGNQNMDPDLASVSEDKPADIHCVEKLVDSDQQVSHDGESGIHVASQTFEQFDSDQSQQALKEHENTQQPHVYRLFETPPPMATPPPDAVLPDEMLALLSSPYTISNNERVVREDHVTFASSRSDQLPPIVQGNLHRDDDKTGSDDFQQPTKTNEARLPETGSQEDRNVIDSREQIDHIDDSNWDLEKLDLKCTQNSQLDQSEDDKPSQDKATVDLEFETTTSDASTEQLTSDPGQSSPDSNYSDNQQSEDKKKADMFDNNDDDYHDNHYLTDVPEPEYTSNDKSGQAEDPELSFEQEEEEQLKLPPAQKVSEECGEEGEKVREEYPSTIDHGDGSSGDSQGQTQSLPSSDNIQSESDTDTSSPAEASPSEAPPTEAPPSVISSFEAKLPSPADMHHPSSDAQPDNAEDKSEGRDPSSASIEDKTFSPEGQAPSSDVENKAPLFEAEIDTHPSEASPWGTEASSTGNESPPFPSDGGDYQQVDTASKLDPSPLGVDDINLQSGGLQPSHFYSSSSVTQFHGGDGEQPTINTEPVVSAPITSSDSAGVGIDGGIRDQEPPSLDEIKAHAEQLRVQWEHGYRQTATNDEDSNVDSHTVQGTATDHESAGVDGDTSSTVADQESGARQEAPHSISRPTEDTGDTSSTVTDQQSGARQEAPHSISRPTEDAGDTSSTVADQQSGARQEAPRISRPTEDTGDTSSTVAGQQSGGARQEAPHSISRSTEDTGNTSSTVFDQQSGARQEAPHISRPTEDAAGNTSSTVSDQQSGARQETPHISRPTEDAADNTSSTVADQQSGARQEAPQISRPTDDAAGNTSSTVADQQSGARQEASHISRPTDYTPYQVHLHVPDRSEDSEPMIEDGVTPSPSHDAYESVEGGALGEDTPTPSQVDTDSALVFEETPSPPRMTYSCRDDYLSMPGHDKGGWMSYHEQVRAHVRDLVLDALPKEWSNWVCHNVSLYIPTTIILLKIWRL